MKKAMWFIMIAAVFAILYAPIMLADYVMVKLALAKPKDDVTVTQASFLGFPMHAVAAANLAITTVPMVASCFAKNDTCKDQGSLPQFQSKPETCQSFRLSKGTPKEGVLLQRIHLEQTLHEECIIVDKNKMSIDHPNARNVVNGCTVGIVFPRSLIGYCECGVWQPKNISYFFSGFETPGRMWVWDYSNNTAARVEFSQSGRNVLRETGLFDYDYYDNLMASRFALAPDGDFHWTYRFLEAIMCGAIPIIPKRSTSKPEDQELGYEYCVHKEPCLFMSNETGRQKAAQRNWLHFLRRHTLIME